MLDTKTMQASLLGRGPVCCSEPQSNPCSSAIRRQSIVVVRCTTRIGSTDDDITQAIHRDLKANQVLLVVILSLTMATEYS